MQRHCDERLQRVRVGRPPKHAARRLGIFAKGDYVFLRRWQWGPTAHDVRFVALFVGQHNGHVFAQGVFVRPVVDAFRQPKV